MVDLSIDITFRYSKQHRCFIGNVTPYRIDAVTNGGHPSYTGGMYPNCFVLPGEEVTVRLPNGSFILSYKKGNTLLDYTIEGITVYLSMNGFPYASYAERSGLRHEGLERFSC